MGRYAQFNTGFEYKFLFASQPSEDIKEFGGQINDTDDDEYNFYYSEHFWTERDKEQILYTLNHFGEGFILPNFSIYDNDISGTYKMYTEEQYCYQYDNIEDKKISKFILGCLIYHQLLYEPNLTVKYEV